MNRILLMYLNATTPGFRSWQSLNSFHDCRQKPANGTILSLLNSFHILQAHLTLPLPLKPQSIKISLPYEILGPIIRLHFSMHIHTIKREGGKRHNKRYSKHEISAEGFCLFVNWTSLHTAVASLSYIIYVRGLVISMTQRFNARLRIGLQ